MAGLPHLMLSLGMPSERSVGTALLSFPQEFQGKAWDQYKNSKNGTPIPVNRKGSGIAQVNFGCGQDLWITSQPEGCVCTKNSVILQGIIFQK